MVLIVFREARKNWEYIGTRGASVAGRAIVLTRDVGGCLGETGRQRSGSPGNRARTWVQVGSGRALHD